MRRRTSLLAAGVAALLVTGLTIPAVIAQTGPVAQAAAADCTAPTWTEGSTYRTGDHVTHLGRGYTALVGHTAHVGAGWTPGTTPSLWTDDGACVTQPDPDPTDPTPDPDP